LFGYTGQFEAGVHPEEGGGGDCWVAAPPKLKFEKTQIL